MPAKNILLSVQESMCDDMVHIAYDLHQLGYHIHATDSTHDFLQGKGVPATLLKFPGGQVWWILSFFLSSFLSFSCSLCSRVQIEIELNNTACCSERKRFVVQ